VLEVGTWFLGNDNLGREVIATHANGAVSYRFATGIAWTATAESWAAWIKTTEAVEL